MLAGSGPVSLGQVLDDKRPQPIDGISTQRIERRPVARITEIIRELDNLRHAPEVLAQYDVLAEANFRVGVKATLRGERMPVRHALQIVMLQIVNGLVGYSNTIRANLLIVAHYHHLFGDVEQEQALNAKLARF